MVEISKKLVVVCFALVLLLVPSILSCANGESEVKVVKIGWISALTGPAAEANDMYLTVMDALRRYTNDHNPIPGVKLEFAVYDTRYDPGKASLGYYKLKEEGVVAMYTADPIVTDTWRPLLERDHIPLLTQAPSKLALAPPSWAFSCVTTFEQLAYGYLEYINDTWDYAGTGRNPRVAAMGWDMAYGRTHGELAAAKAAEFDCDFVLQELVPIGTMDMSINLRHVADAGADYVLATLLPAPFLSVLREANTRYPGQMVFMQTYLPFKPLEDAVGPALLDGVVDVAPVVGFDVDCPGIRQATEMFQEYAPKVLQDWRDPGAIMTIPSTTLLFESIRMVVAEKGVDAINGDNVYDAMQRAEVDTGGLVEGIFKYGYDTRVISVGTQILEFHAATETWELVGGGQWFGVGYYPY